MKIAIRADGGLKIGMGHIMRTLVIAKELAKANEVFYVCKDNISKYSIGIEKVKSEGFDVRLINEDRIKYDIMTIDADCIITDSYDVDEEYFDILKDRFKISGCFDDENILDFFNVDFIINQNTYAKELKYRTNSHCGLMLGSDFIILRDEFRDIVKKDIHKEIKNIMITVGSTDNSNITLKILNELENFKFDVDVVVGAGFIFAEELKRFVQGKSKNAIVRLHFNANMSELMQKADVAVAACGTTVYELARCGTPTIGITIVENQRMAAEDMEKRGLIAYARNVSDIHNIVEMFDYSTRTLMSEKQQQLVDGDGYKRIAEHIYNK